MRYAICAPLWLMMELTLQFLWHTKCGMPIKNRPGSQIHKHNFPNHPSIQSQVEIERCEIVEADALEMHKMAFSFVCAMNARVLLPLWWVFFLRVEWEFCDFYGQVALEFLDAFASANGAFMTTTGLQSQGSGLCVRVCVCVVYQSINLSSRHLA